jgi:NAD(P)-dependent dehydrogenase (short-subunit alcohol dehydrogenase family)
MNAKTVLITGASTGIGQATAELFFARGWNVVATMRTPRSERTDPRWMVVRLDVTDAASITQALHEATARFGRIDVLVNNAGYGLNGTFESMSEAQIQRQFETNVFGLMRVARSVLPQFRAQRDGVLVNVASMGGRLTFPFYSIYHATKWAVDGFSESLAFELEPLGIRVKIIEPGAIRTDFYDRSQEFVHDPALSDYTPLVEKGMRRMTRAGQRGAPAGKVAQAIWQAATDNSPRLRYVVGIDAKSLLALRALVSNRVYMGIVKSQLLK